MNTGIYPSEETKRKMSKAHMGHVVSEETRRKMSTTRKGMGPSETTRLKLSEAKKGARNSLWNGGRCANNGYVMILAMDHPYADKKGYVREHRLVVEKDTKRYLMPDEIVHHWNGIRNDNRPENLLVCNDAAHKAIHKTMRKVTQ